MVCARRIRRYNLSEAVMPLHVGEKVLYPGMGVFTITDKFKKTIGGKSIEFFNLVPVRDVKLRVLIPTVNVEEIGLRKLREKSKIATAYRILKEGQIAASRIWRIRYKQNLDKINSGSLLQVAEVVKSLTELKKRNGISMREEQMLDKARRLLINEIAHSLGAPREKIRAKVDNLLLGKDGKTALKKNKPAKQRKPRKGKGKRKR